MLLFINKKYYFCYYFMEQKILFWRKKYDFWNLRILFSMFWGWQVCIFKPYVNRQMLSTLVALEP